MEETNAERFKRLATARTNEILKKIDILGHCHNRSNYEYSQEQVNQIFLALERKINEIKLKFKPNAEEFRL